MLHGQSMFRMLSVLLAVAATGGHAGCKREPQGSGGAQPEATVSEEAPWFADVTEASGVDFVHDPGATGSYYFPENMGSGCALIDVDNDGDLDAYLVQGGSLSNSPGGPVRRDALYLNDGAGRFEPAGDLGLADPSFGMGVSAADYNADGLIDLYVTNVGPNRLLANRGGGRFEDVTAAAGVGGTNDFSTSSAWLDVDGDGALDLYVANYIVWSLALDAPCYAETGPRDYCTPLTYRSAPDRLYRNLGDGTFEDISMSSRIGLEPFNGLGVGVLDVNADGRDDIYVANDQQANLLWVNAGDNTFRNEALVRGCAFNDSGMAEASMGVLAQDLDGDGDPDLLATHLRGETHTFYRNMGTYFADDTRSSGLGRRSVRDTGFGVGSYDFNHDQLLDMFIVNGAVNLRGRAVSRDNPYAEPDALLRGTANGVYALADVACGAACAEPRMGRGVAFGDIDHDGDIDMLVSNNRGGARLYRNDAGPKGHWLTVRVLDGRGGDALGSRVTVQVGTWTATRVVRSGGSYLSASDYRLHFGLGPHDVVDRVTVRRPDGRVQELRGASANQHLEVPHP